MKPLSYADYLQLDSLLSLQNPRVPETAGREVVLAERFFIVAHQCCELWLKQAVDELDAAIEALSPPYRPGEQELSLEFLERVGEVLRVLYEHVMCLEKLPLRYFAEFRPHLGGASGAQSIGFRCLEERLGDDQRTGPLYEAFSAAAAEVGRSVSEICWLGVHAGILHWIGEALLDIGNGYWRWKVAHLALVSKMLGTQHGTGGTNGSTYLAGRITMPFPELRMLRGQVHRTSSVSGPARE